MNIFDVVYLSDSYGLIALNRHFISLSFISEELRISPVCNQPCGLQLRSTISGYRNSVVEFADWENCGMISFVSLNIYIQSSIVNCLCINVSLNGLCLNRFTSYAPVSQNENICVLCTHSFISNMQKKREQGYRYAYMLCQ